MADKTENERDRILAEYDEELRKVKGQQEDQKNAQRDAMLAKIAARKRMKEELTKEDAVAKELDRITKAQVSKGDEDSAEVISHIASQLNSGEVSSEEEALRQEQEAALAELDAKHRQSEREAEKELAKELEKSTAMVEEQMDEQTKLVRLFISAKCMFFLITDKKKYCIRPCWRVFVLL